MSLLAGDRSPTSSAAHQAAPRPDLRRLPQQQWPAALAANLRTGLSGFLRSEILHLRPGAIEARSRCATS